VPVDGDGDRTAPPFAAWSDEALLACGAPAEWLSTGRGATGIEDFADRVGPELPPAVVGPAELVALDLARRGGDRGHARQRCECRLGPQPAGGRPGAESLGGADRSDARRGEPGRSSPPDDGHELELRLERPHPPRGQVQRGDRRPVPRRVRWGRPQPGAVRDQGAGREAAEPLAERLLRIEDERLEVADRPRSHRSVARGEQDAQDLPLSAAAGLCAVLAGQGLAGSVDGIHGVRLGAVAATARDSGTRTRGTPKHETRTVPAPAGVAKS
jgi:hypothetical protein